jgi:voltage-gated potassium channel
MKYLSSQLGRRLNPKLRIVSRITHERNIEAVHRAGADFVLSYTSLGVESIMSLERQRRGDAR